MSVTLQTPYTKSIAAPAAQVFPTGFRVILAGDLSVKVNGVTVTSGFTLTGLNDPSGVNVTFTAPMAGGEIVELQRIVPQTRAVDYQQLGDYQAMVVNADLDRIVMMIQDANFRSNLYLRLPDGDTSAPAVLPAQADRLDRMIAFDAITGDMVMSTFTQAQIATAIAAAYASGSLAVSSYIATLLDDATAEEARQTLGVVFMASSIAALKAFAKTPGATAVVYGYYAAGDGGGGVYWYDASDTTSTDNGGSIIVASDGGRWKIAQSFPMSLKQWGAKGDSTTDDTARIQAALDAIEAAGGELFVDRAIFKTTDTLYWGNGCTLVGVGYDSLIKGASLTKPMFQSKGTTISRRYRLQMRNLGIDNTTKTAVGGIAVDLRNATDCLLDNIYISNVETGVQHFADAGLGCYYNELRKCVFTTCTLGVTYSTLANENWLINSRFNGVATGVRLSDGSHNHIIEPAIEIFTTGILISGAAYDTQITSPRLENVPTSGTGISITGAAVRTSIKDPQYTGLSTNLNDAAGIGTTQNGRQRVTATLNFPSIPAGSTSDLAVAVSGALPTDSVQVTPPSTLASGLVCIAVPSSSQVYVRMANVTAGAIDPASATFTVDIWRKE